MCDLSMDRQHLTHGWRGTEKEATAMSDGSKCRKCQQVIHWHRSKMGKAYPCNSEDRRDFHKCGETAAAPQPATAPAIAKPQAALSIEQRIQWLESEVRGLLIQMDGLGS
jgi:hypothetical protein